MQSDNNGSGVIEKIKSFFGGIGSNSKKIKFFALVFVVMVLLYLAISPIPTSHETIEEVGKFSLQSLGKKVRFADNLVTHIWTK